MPPSLTDEDRKLLDKVLGKFADAEKVQKQHRTRWEHFYRQYRSYSEFRQYAQDSLPRDVDRGLREMKREFGAELFIPVGYWTVETVLPRMLSQSPRMLILPRDSKSSDNADNMKFLVEAQQEQIDYELVLQDVGKDGLIYGLGVQKTYWETRSRKTKAIAKGTKSQWVQTDKVVQDFDDPMAEAVDPFDFFWDPYAVSVKTADYVIHRTWRTSKYVIDRLEQDWIYVDLTNEDVTGSGAQDKYDETWQQRMKASGFDRPEARGSQVHEVWEYHDREQCIVILDRKWPVKVDAAPYWHGELPFQIFRPTRLPKSFVGIGEIEPLEDLQQEINTLRSQRRDNATLVLQKTFAYYDGLVDPDMLRFGPGVGIPVEGDPRELLFPIPVGDIPASGYQEESALLQDIERTSGISDSVTGAEGTGTSQTATGAQLVHAAANVRIQNKTKLLEKETIKAAARQFVALNQQKITATGQKAIRIPEPGDAERRWTWRPLGPAEVAGEFEVLPEGGSTAPDNTPQMRQDGQLLYQMFSQNPGIDQQRLLPYVLKQMGIEQPETWLAPEQKISPAVLDLIGQQLQQAGVPPQQIQQIIGGAVQQAAAADQQGQPQDGPPGQPAPNGNGNQQQQGVVQ